MILCPKCKGKSRIISTKPDKGGSARRRRACLACDERWSTLETFAQPKPRPKMSPETIIKIRVARRSKLDFYLARRRNIPIELVAEYRRIVNSGKWKAEEAAQIIRDHAAKHGHNFQA